MISAWLNNLTTGDLALSISLFLLIIQTVKVILLALESEPPRWPC